MFFKDKSETNNSNYDRKMSLALRSLQPNLDSPENRTSLINTNYPSHLASLLNKLQELSPPLDTQENFNLLLENSEFIPDIGSIVSDMPTELRTQENFNALFQCLNHLKDVKQKIAATLRFTGGNNSTPPLTQERFDEIINEGAQALELPSPLKL